MPQLLVSAASTFLYAGVSLVLYILIIKPLYNLLLHPLRAVPGPLLWRMSPLPRSVALCRGSLAFKVAEHHAKYGEVIRVGPNELAFLSAQAWRDIYGHRSAGEEENHKDIEFYQISKKQPQSIISSGRAEHGELRRQLAHGFSEKSMRGQEPIIGGYVDMLLQKLHENANKGALNMRDWYNWTTFDIIGNLGFGSDFNCLTSGNYTGWARIIADSVKIATWFQSLGYLGFGPLAGAIMELGLSSISDQRELTHHKLQERIELGKKMERPDFIEGLIKKNLPMDKLKASAGLLLVAGSETTATLLCGATYFLTTNPHVLERLTTEVRQTFEKSDDITLLSVNNLPYMLACLNETLRRYPPVAIGLPRLAARGGVTVAGTYVPEGTSIAVWQWAINHRPSYWTQPEEFIPERWTGDKRFQNDQFDAMQPFSVGPRNCIGRNLAYAEMRLILARLLLDFDLTLAEDSRNWLASQKCYSLWDKPSLNVHLTPVHRAA